MLDYLFMLVYLVDKSQFGGDRADLGAESLSEGSFFSLDTVLVLADFLPVLVFRSLSDGVLLEELDVSGGGFNDGSVLGNLGFDFLEELGDGSDLDDLLLGLDLQVVDGFHAVSFLSLSEGGDGGVELAEHGEDLAEGVLVGEASAFGHGEEGGDEGAHAVVGVGEHGLEFSDLVVESLDLDEALALLVLGDQFVGDDVLEDLDDDQFLLGFDSEVSVVFVGLGNLGLELGELLLTGGEVSAVLDFFVLFGFIVGLGLVGGGSGFENVSLDLGEVGGLDGVTGSAFLD